MDNESDATYPQRTIRREKEQKSGTCHRGLLKRWSPQPQWDPVPWQGHTPPTLRSPVVD